MTGICAESRATLQALLGARLGRFRRHLTYEHPLSSFVMRRLPKKEKGFWGICGGKPHRQEKQITFFCDGTARAKRCTCIDETKGRYDENDILDGSNDHRPHVACT